MPVLLYSEDELGTMVFAPSDTAAEVRATRAALAQCETWGQARQALAPARFAELQDQLIAPVDQPASDTRQLDGAAVAEAGWPKLSYSEIEDWIPDSIASRFGEHFSSMMSSGVNLPGDQAAEIVGALESMGYQCVEDPTVAELFDPGEDLG